MRTCIDEGGSSNIGMLLTYVFVYNCVDLDMTAYIKPGASCSIEASHVAKSLCDV